MNVILKNSLRIIVWLSCCLSAVALHAEDMDDYFDSSPVELATIPVSIAAGSPKTVFQSAAVTSVVTAEQIKTMGATELHEVLETIPGMHASMQVLTGDYHYSLRGIRNATNSELLFLLNGTRITTPFQGTLMTSTELPLEAIEQIEVIRGPGSALYGADAFAGVVNIITKTAKDIDGLKLGVRAGDHNTQSGWGQYGGQWAGWDIAGSLQYQRTDGDHGRVLKADSQTRFDQKLLTQASYAPSALNTDYEIFNGHLNLQRQHWKIGLWATNDQSGTRAGVVSALDPEGVAKGEQYLADVRFSTEDWLEDWVLNAHGSYLRADFQVHALSFPRNALLPIGLSDGMVSLESMVSDKPYLLKYFPDGMIRDLAYLEEIKTLEISSMYKGLDKHLLRADIGFRHEQISPSHRANISGMNAQSAATVVDGTLIDLTGTEVAYMTDVQRSIWSAALQDEWQLAEGWQLTTGVRYSYYSDFGDTVNPRVALIWDVNPQLTSKWLYGEAFRAPSFSELYNKNNLALLGNPNLAPETMRSYEWALDYRPFSALRTAANLYYYQLQNSIALVKDKDAASFTFQNTGDREGYGVELEGHWQVSEQWSLLGNYAWQHAVNQATQQRVAGVPEHQVYAAAVWQFLSKWQLQAQLNWIGGRINPVPANGALADYQTVDFTLRSQQLLGGLNVSASLRNAFDTTPREPTNVTIGDNLPMPGRSFYLEASLHF